MAKLLLFGVAIYHEEIPKEGAAIIGVTCLGTVGFIITHTLRRDNLPRQASK